MTDIGPDETPEDVQEDELDSATGAGTEEDPVGTFTPNYRGPENPC